MNASGGTLPATSGPGLGNGGGGGSGGAILIHATSVVLQPSGSIIAIGGDGMPGGVISHNTIGDGGGGGGGRVSIVTGAGGFSGSLASIDVSGGAAGGPGAAAGGLGQVAVVGSFVVTNTSDSGIGSLRQAILNANANPGPDTIDFAPGLSGTIVLTSGELQITNDVTIVGPGANLLDHRRQKCLSHLRRR